MRILSEFKEFIARGNVVELAVGVIVGGAFGKIVTSFVGDVLMPPLGIITGGINLTQLKIRLGGTDVAPISLNYGQFIQNVIDFLIISIAIFGIVKGINTLKREEGAEATCRREEELLTEIRDILKRWR